MSRPEFENVQKPLIDPDNIYAAGAVEPPRKSRGCFFYGCLILVILAVLAAIAAVVGGFALYSWWMGMVNSYTGTAPVPIQSVAMSVEDKKVLDDRWAAFKAALDKDEAAEIVLTADEVNALIAENEDLKDHVHVDIKDDQLGAQVSFPLDKFGAPSILGLKGRYFNGHADVKVSVEDGELVVILLDGDVNGKKLPADAKKQLAEKNLAESFNSNPDQRKMIRKFQSITIKDSKVYIKSKPKKGSESEDDVTKPDAAKTDEEKAKDLPVESKKANNTEAKPPVDDPAKKAETPADPPKAADPAKKADDPAKTEPPKLVLLAPAA